jgi:hypothetical protein
MTENISSSSLENDTAVSWSETIPLQVRRKRAIVRLAIATLLAAFFLYMGYSNGEFDNKSLAWSAIIFGIGLILFWTNLNNTKIQRFATERIELSKMQRAKKAFPFWLLGYGGTFSIWGMQYRFDDLKENWHFGLGFLIIALVGHFIYSNLKYENKPTLEAAQLQTAQAESIATEPVIPSEFEMLLERLWERKLVRFPASFALYWSAYELSQSDYPKKWVFTAFLVIMGLGAAPELIVFVIGASVAIALLVFGFNVVASLPVSIAVIIGALIIASALKK